MSLGFQNAGFDIVAAFDDWEPAIDVYRNNFKHPIYQRDLSDPKVIKEIASYKADIIIGGPPCQDFSIAGYRIFQGQRANLTLVFTNIVSTILPKWFVMENVYNIDKSPVFDRALTALKKAGYGITKGIFDASRMGVPQMRRRYFVIGKYGAKDDLLLEALNADLSPNRMTVREYLGDRLGTDFYFMHPRSYNRRAIFSIDEPSSTIRGSNRPISARYRPHAADKTTDLSRVRPLTTKERSYIQTFPARFALEGTRSNLEQLIGNAVPVKMAEYVARHILDKF
jgi:DNA (cytosine-5)-methyltransferase 1